MSYTIREISPITARGATGAARTTYSIRELPPESKSNVFAQAGSGAVEGLAGMAGLVTDAPAILGGLADWMGGEGTSKSISNVVDTVAHPVNYLGAHALNAVDDAASYMRGIDTTGRDRLDPNGNLSDNYRQFQQAAGSGALKQHAQNAGLISQVGPENNAQRYARKIGEFMGGSAIPVGATLNIARNAAKAGTAGSFLAPIAANPGKFIRGNALAATTGAVAGEAAFDATGSETARFAGGLLGGFIPGMADAGFRRLMTGGAGGREAIREGMALYNDIGAMPTLGQATANVKGTGGGISRFLDRTAAAFNPRLYESRLAEQAAGAERATKNAIASATNDVAAPPSMNLGDLLDPIGAITNPKEYARRVADQMAKVEANLKDATGIQQKMMPSDITAGQAAQAGGRAFKDRFTQGARQEYQKLDEMLPKDAPASMDNTLSAFNEILTPVPGAPATSARLASKTIGAWQKALLTDIDAAQKAGTAIPYQALKKIRSRVYEALNKEGDGLAPNASRAELQKLYGAITDDMRATAQAVGGDAAVAQLERANSIYAQGARRLEEVFDPILRADTPEGVFRAIEGADASRLAQFFSGIDPSQRASIVGRVFAKMGQSRNADGMLTGSEFNWNTFLTNYNKMSKSRSLEVLFNAHSNPNLGGAGVKQMKSALDKLADMASRARFMERQLYNPSGTAARLTDNLMNAGVPMVAGMGLLTGGLSPAAAGGLVALRFLGKAGASALNSPKFLQYLAQTPSIGPQKWAGHFARMTQIARNEGLGPEIQSLTDSMSKRSPEDNLTFLLSPIPGMGGVVATANDARKYVKGERDLSAENLALTAMNIIPEHAALRGMEDASGAMMRMDPAMGAVGIAARDPETFLKSLDFNLPKNQGLNIAGGVSEPLARAYGVPLKENDPQKDQQQNQIQGGAGVDELRGVGEPAQRAGQSGGDLLGGRIVNALESALLGGGDELLAFLQSPAQEQRRMIGLESGDATPTYDRELGTARGLMDQYQKERPGEALAVGIGAGLAAPLGVGGKFISRGKGFAGTGARAAAVGGGTGAVSGYGMGRGDDRANAAADGAFWGSVAGGTLGATLPGVINGIKWIRNNSTAFNLATGTLSRDGAAMAKAVGINPKGMERELNLVVRHSIDIANQVMKDPQGARNLIRRGIEGLGKNGGADVDGNILIKTFENVFSDKSSVYDPVWRRIFGEGLNPDKPLGKAVRGLIERKIGPDKKSWQPILSRVLDEVEKRVGPIGPQSRFWNVDEYADAPIAPKVETVDDVMLGIKPSPQSRPSAPPSMYSMNAPQNTKSGEVQSRAFKPIFSTYNALRPYAMDAWARARGTRSKPAWVSQPVASRKVQASQMRAGGAKPNDVWRKTGLYMHADGKWRTDMWDDGGYDAVDQDVIPLLSGVNININKSREVGNSHKLHMAAVYAAPETRAALTDLLKTRLRMAETPAEKEEIRASFKASMALARQAARDMERSLLSDVVNANGVYRVFPRLGRSVASAQEPFYATNSGILGAYHPRQDVQKNGRRGFLKHGAFQLPGAKDGEFSPLSDAAISKSTVRHEMQHGIQDEFGQIHDAGERGEGRVRANFKDYLSSPHEVEARLVEERANQSDVVKWHYPPDYEAKLRRDLYDLEARGFFGTAASGTAGAAGGYVVSLPLIAQAEYEKDPVKRKEWDARFSAPPIEIYRFKLGLRVNTAPKARAEKRPP